MNQLLSTFDRSGRSNGNTIFGFCSGERLLYSVVTRVSDVDPVSFLGAAAAIAAPAVPKAAVLRKRRRSTESQSGHCMKFLLGGIIPDVGCWMLDVGKTGCVRSEERRVGKECRSRWS